MILVNHYAIRPPIPQTIFIKHCRVEIMVLPFMLFHRDRFFNFRCLFRQPQFYAACLLNLFLLPHRVYTTLLSLSGVTTQSLLAGVCAACMLAYRHFRMKWWAAVVVVAIPSQKALLMCPYVSSSKCSVLAPCYSCDCLHNLQPTSDRRLICASHLVTRMIPEIAVVSRLLCLQGTRGSL